MNSIKILGRVKLHIGGLWGKMKTLFFGSFRETQILGVVNWEFCSRNCFWGARAIFSNFS